MTNSTLNTNGKQGIVNIHGKDYMTVVRRVELAHEDKALDSVETEVLSHDPVVVKAKVYIKGKLYTGISSVSLASAKMIEKQNPYEVAETSAVGRALGFAGYGLIESIASADEVIKSESVREEEEEADQSLGEKKVCSAHDEPVTMFRGVSKTKLDANGNPKAYWWHKDDLGRMCFGAGFN